MSICQVSIDYITDLFAGGGGGGVKNLEMNCKCTTPDIVALFNAQDNGSFINGHDG